MKNLRENKPIWHAMVWVAIYIAAMNLGGYIAELYPSVTWATSAVLAVIVAALLVYIFGSGTAQRYWVKAPNAGSLSRTLYIMPLLAITFFQYAKGLSAEIDFGAALVAASFVIFVGFIEEMLFRGFLLEALLKRGNVTRAALISGATFGLGHVVNLANGYSGVDQIIQIVAAIVIGVALAYVVVLTGSILPGVVFHVLFNLGGTISAANTAMDAYILGAVIVVMVPYILYLRRRLAHVDSGSTVGA